MFRWYLAGLAAESNPKPPAIGVRRLRAGKVDSDIAFELGQPRPTWCFECVCLGIPPLDSGTDSPANPGPLSSTAQFEGVGFMPSLSMTLSVSFSCQPDTGNQARAEINEGAVQPRHTGVRVEHHRSPVRCW